MVESLPMSVMAIPLQAMLITDVFRFAGGSLSRSGIRSLLMLLAMAIGVAAVVVLTSLGEGARRYVTGEFSSLGTNLLIVIPGRSETSGAAPTIFVGQTPRDLTLDDAVALLRSSAVQRIAPVVVGSAPVSYGGLEREVPVFGSSADLLSVRRWAMQRGSFLPAGEIERASSVCVIGEKLRAELFGEQPAIGQWLRVGDRRFRVIGVLASEGRSIGIDVQELVIVPVASALSLFNSSSLFRILVEARDREAIPAARQAVREIITSRHQGEEDVTVITQDAVLATFDRIFLALTMALAGIAAISLLVAGVLIMNVMLVAVSQRTAEIGLLKALGAQQHQVVRLFLAEALLLSMAGALVGLVLGQAGSMLIGELYPALPMGPPLWAIVAAVLVAVGCGLVFGLLPARRAARLDPVLALAGK